MSRALDQRALILLSARAIKSDECKAAGYHLGHQEDLGPASGRYNPNNNYRCTHCENIYESRGQNQEISGLTQKL